MYNNISKRTERIELVIWFEIEICFLCWADSSNDALAGTGKTELVQSAKVSRTGILSTGNGSAGCQRRAGIPVGKWKTRSPSRNGNCGVQCCHGANLFDPEWMWYLSVDITSQWRISWDTNYHRYSVWYTYCCCLLWGGRMRCKDIGTFFLELFFILM